MARPRSSDSSKRGGTPRVVVPRSPRASAAGAGQEIPWSLFPGVLTAAAFIPAVARIVTALVGGGGRSWGLDAVVWTGWTPLTIVLSLVPALALFPAIRGTAARLLADVRPLSRGMTILLTVSASAALAGLGLLLPVAYAFLGDGSIYAAELYRALTVPEYHPSLLKPSAWLTGHVLHALTHALQPEDIRLPFTLAGIIGAVAFVIALTAHLRGERRVVAVLVISLLLGSGGVLFFFGYVELYAVSYALAAAALLAIWRMIRRNGSVTAAAALLAAAAAFGLAAIVFLPAFLLAWHWRLRGMDGGPLRFRPAAVVLAAACVVAVAGAYAWLGISADQPYLLPLTAAERWFGTTSLGWMRYTVFSSAHMADVLNAILLCGGSAVPLLLVAAMRARAAGAARDPLVLCMGMAAWGGLLLLLFGQSLFGLARDWDVAALPSLGIVMFAAAILVRLDESGATDLRAVVPAVLLVSFSGSALWIAVNADEQASMRRFDGIVELDAGSILARDVYTGLEHLRKFHQAGRDRAAAHDVLWRMERTGYDRTETWRKLLALASGAPTDAEREMELRAVYAAILRAASDVRTDDRFDVVPRTRLREFASRALLEGVQQRQDAAVRGAIPGFSVAFGADWNELPFIQSVLAGAGPSERAAAARRFVNGCSDPSLLYAAAGAFDADGDAASAVGALERAVELAPTEFPRMYIEIARLQYEKLGNAGLARLALQRCIDMVPGSAEAADARRILARMPQP